MNSENLIDLSHLSYRELQSLAIKYQVPGNVKKSLLIQILQAARNSQDEKVMSLIHNLKKTRKKRGRKSKNDIFGITSTTTPSANYVMNENYHPQHESMPYQWVAAEEETLARMNNRKFCYEEYQEDPLRRIKQQYETYHKNNYPYNQTIMDLSGVGCSTPTVPHNFNESHMTVANENYAYASNNQLPYHLLNDTKNNFQRALLLRRMLQAPVGANLRAIASPIPKDCQSCSNEAMEDSDTLTAESDSNYADETIEKNPYSFFQDNKNEYLTNQNLRNNEAIEQFPSLLNNTETPYLSNETNLHQNYSNWNPPVNTSENNLSKFQSFCCNNIQNFDRSVNDINYQSQYPPQENSINLSIEANQYHHANEDYYLQNFIKNTEDYNQLRNVPAMTDLYVPMMPDTLGRYLDNDSGIANQQYSIQSKISTNSIHSCTKEHVDIHDDVQNKCHDDVRDLSNHSSVSDEIQSSGTLDRFWPKWPLKDALENILHTNTSSLDYTKINHTSSVDCYSAPVVTEKPVEANRVCSQMKKGVVKNRQHCFSSNYLLFNNDDFYTRKQTITPINTLIHVNVSECNADGDESMRKSQEPMANDNETSDCGINMAADKNNHAISQENYV